VPLPSARLWPECHQQQPHPSQSQTRELGHHHHGMHLLLNPRGHHRSRATGSGILGQWCRIRVCRPGEQKERSTNPHKEWGEKRKNLQKLYSMPLGTAKALARGLEPPEPIVAAGLLPAAFMSGVESACTTPGPPLPAPLTSVVAVVFLAVAFGSSVAMGASFTAVATSSPTAIATFVVVAFSASAYTAMNPPPSEPLDHIAIAAFFTVTFLVLACVAMDPPPSEPHACPVAASLGACCPYDTGSKMKHPSLQTSLLFFSRGTVSSDDASALLDRGRELSLEADPDGAIFPFPLLEPEVVSAHLRPPTSSILRI
jgi:hypothetical protein